jgi:RNA polymerase sigma-70 factor (ECF subfamily)
MAITSKYHVTEEQLLTEQDYLAASRRDPAKFAFLYNKYHEPVFRFVYQRLDDKDLAFDLTSQVFLKALTHLPKYEFRGLPFSSWLYRIASNELNQLFRRNKAQRTINVETENLSDMMEEMEEHPLEQYQNLLLGELTALPEDDLHLVEMRFFEKRPFKEIGEIMDITENNAKVKLYRILEKLKKKLTAKNTQL